MNNLFVIGIFLAFFLQFLLFSKKGKTLPDKILGVWMFVIGLHLFSYYIYNLGYWERFPHLTGITHPFPLLHGPLLFLYVVFSLRKEQHFGWRDFAHFLPALGSYLYMMPYFFGYTIAEKRLVDSGQMEDYKTFMYLSLVGFIISGITYPVVAYHLITKHERLVHENYSFDESISLNWLKYCIGGLGLIFLSVGIISFMQYLLDVQFPFNVDFIFYAEIILFILFVGYFGIRHQGIFAENKTTQEATSGNDDTDTKKTTGYIRSGLKTDEAQELHQKLLQLMNEKKPYLEPKLTLNMLATQLDVSSNHLSQTINQHQNQNFYDFINQYRVEEFKQRAKDPKNQHFNILALALDSGFNSKSAFNLIFKKHTGITPSHFMSENSRP